MTLCRLLTAGALCLAATPGLASSCTDRIGALEARLNQTGATAAAASSGGQAVAAAREGQAMEARDQNRAPSGPTPPFQDERREAQATRRAAEAGAGGDRVVQAKAKLNHARTLDLQGDGPGCLEAVAEAGRQMDASP